MNPNESEPGELQQRGSEGAASDLRAWAKGSLATEAAVELLLGASHGRLAAPGWPWLPSSRGRIWLDATQIATATGGLSASEVRSLSIIESLVIGAPIHDLAGCWQDSTRAPLLSFSRASTMPEVAWSRPMIGSSTIKIMKAITNSKWERTHDHHDRGPGVAATHRLDPSLLTREVRVIMDAKGLDALPHRPGQMAPRQQQAPS